MWGSVARRGGSSAGSLPRKPGEPAARLSPSLLIPPWKGRASPVLHGPPLLPQVVWTDNDAGECGPRGGVGVGADCRPLAIPKGLGYRKYEKRKHRTAYRRQTADMCRWENVGAPLCGRPERRPCRHGGQARPVARRLWAAGRGLSLRLLGDRVAQGVGGRLAAPLAPHSPCGTPGRASPTPTPADCLHPFERRLRLCDPEVPAYRKGSILKHWRGRSFST